MTQEQIYKISKIAYLITLLMAILWVIAIVLPTYFHSQKQEVLAYFARKLFSFICHQMEDRSFWFWDYPLAVCARCSGIYFGVLLGTLFYPLIKKYQKTDLLPQRYLVLMLLPTTIDFLLGLFHIVENTHFSRAFTGILAGFALAFYFTPAIINLALELTQIIANKRKGVIFYGSK